MSNVIIAVHGFSEITNSKHQITNINDLNDFDNFNIDKDIFFNSCAFHKEQKIGIWEFGDWEFA